MRKIKILEVSSVDGTIYFLLLPLMKALKQKGFVVEASCSYGELVPLIEKEGFSVHDIYINRGYNLISHFISLIKLTFLIRKHRYAVVHVHTPIAAFVGRIAAHFARTPIVLYTIHGFYFHENTPYLFKKIIILIEKLLARYTTFAFSQSEEDVSVAIRENIFPSDKIAFIGNGIDLSFFNRSNFTKEDFIIKRKEFNLSTDDIVVTCVARMTKEKGILDLLEAAKKVVRKYNFVHFVFVGGITKGNERKVINKQFIDKFLCLDPLYSTNFHFLGTRKDVRDILAISDIFVLPSYREGMPRSIIEAMAMELPVVATNIRGSREEVVDGKTGMLVSVKDPDALSDAILKLATDDKLRVRMGISGRKRAEELFDENKVIEKQLIVLDRLLSKYGRKKNTY